MALALRRMVLVAIMVLALLAGMLGWTMRMQAAPLPHSTGLHSTHTLAMICPPPPYAC